MMGLDQGFVVCDNLEMIVAWVVLIAASVWYAAICITEAIREEDLSSGILLALGGLFYCMEGWRKWLTIVYLVMFFVAVAVLGDSVSFELFSLWYIAVGVLAVAVMTTLAYREVGSASEKSRRLTAERATNLERRGKVGSGVVMKCSDTGVRLGSTSLFTLLVNVELPNGADQIVAVQQEEWPPDIANWLNRRVAVRFDPEDPTNAELLTVPPESDSEANSLANARAAKILAEQQSLLEELNEHGLVAKAVVEKYTSLNVALNEEGLLAQLTVTVLPEKEPTFRSEFTAALSYERLAKYQPGQFIWVRYDAIDNSRVTLDFARMGGTVSHDADVPLRP